MEKEMEKEKNMIIMKIYYLLVNFQMEENGMENNMIQKIFLISCI